MIAEHDRVVLRIDMPGEKLVAGDIGTVVHVHRSGAAYEAEFIPLDGGVAAIVTLERSQVWPIAPR